MTITDLVLRALKYFIPTALIVLAGAWLWVTLAGIAELPARRPILVLRVVQPAVRPATLSSPLESSHEPQAQDARQFRDSVHRRRSGHDAPASGARRRLARNSPEA